MAKRLEGRVAIITGAAQGIGASHAAVFVEELKGSYTGVVGLPLFETAALLADCGVGFWLTARAA